MKNSTVKSMSSYASELACPSVRWLGIHPSDIKPLLLQYQTLSTRDERKIELLLERSYLQKNENLKSQVS